MTKKLTKELLDKVREIEGFPIGEDEDIIALSDPPHYTACPNPFIEDFIKEHGKPYDEETDDYHREPFSTDVSEGKNDPIYNAHGYHTKVPYKAIMRYILHYTDPGDVIFDGFCGSGMTGVAAQMCGGPELEFKIQVERSMGIVKWGIRKVILNDLSPFATLISTHYNKPVNYSLVEHEASRILEFIRAKYGWMYETNHKNGEIGKVNYIVWSDVFICPDCGTEIIFSHVGFDHNTQAVKKSFSCPGCQVRQTKRSLDRCWVSKYDDVLNKTIKLYKQVPVLINYSYKEKVYTKSPDAYDLNLLDSIDRLNIPHWVPSERIPLGDKTNEPKRLGLTNIHHLYSRRALIVLSEVFKIIEGLDDNIRGHVCFIFQQSIMGMSKMARYVPTHYSQVNQYLNGTLYIGSQIVDVSLDYILGNKIKRLRKVFSQTSHFNNKNFLISTGTAVKTQIPNGSVDYIFTDPPFGSNLMYSELNYIFEAWLKVKTNQKTEAIINLTQKKSLDEYHSLMISSFKEMYRMLKPGRWITVVFHNSKNSIWNAIQDSLLNAGFVIADVRFLDKKQGSFNQVSYTTTMKQDLVVNAYKPLQSVEVSVSLHNKESVWTFVESHMTNLPLYVYSDNSIVPIFERTPSMLYDRMIAYYIQRGYSIPISSPDFYKGLHLRFPERDGVYFLHEQVSKYDKARLSVSKIGQLNIFITDEKSSLLWLRNRLDCCPQTYAEIQPDFMRESNYIGHEQKLELSELLEQNFLIDEQGKWYVPDSNRQSDLEKIREKALLREFEEYKNNKSMLKVLRTEAVRAGFKSCWQNRDYETIVKVANRIPESILQEDQTMLMFYNNALTRVEK